MSPGKVVVAAAATTTDRQTPLRQPLALLSILQRYGAELDAAHSHARVPAAGIKSAACPFAYLAPGCTPTTHVVCRVSCCSRMRHRSRRAVSLVDSGGSAPLQCGRCLGRRWKRREGKRERRRVDSWWHSPLAAVPCLPACLPGVLPTRNPAQADGLWPGPPTIATDTHRRNTT